LEATHFYNRARLDHWFCRRTSLRASEDRRKGSEDHIYGYVQGVVHPDGSMDFTLHELSEDDLVRSKWPNAPLDAIHECYIHNADE